MPDRPNIVFVVLDTVRAANLSAYGYNRDTSPFLDRFAQRSIDYRHAYAPAPWTTPSHASMFTGTYVVTHQTNRDNEHLNPDLPTLAELFQEADYETIGFSNNAHVSPDFDFDRGFEEFVFNTESYNEPLDAAVTVSQVRSYTDNEPIHKQALQALQYIRENDGSISKTTLNWLYRKASETNLVSNRDRGAARTNDFVEQYLQDADERPFFLYLNYMEGHAPYQCPDEYQYRYVADPAVSEWGSQADYFGDQVLNQESKVSDLKNQYDGCISYLDSKIEELVDLLKTYDCFTDTLVVITSDHGEVFGEWGLYEHKAGLYDELTHVPLLVNPPEDDRQTIDDPVSVRWLFPTLLEAADIPVPNHVVSADLRKPSNEPIILESEGLPYGDNVYESSLSPKFSQPHQGCVMDGQKLIRYEWDDSVEMFDIDNESVDITSKRTDQVEWLSEAMNVRLRENRRPIRSDKDGTNKVAEETREHLRELGYR